MSFAPIVCSVLCKEKAVFVGVTCARKSTVNISGSELQCSNCCLLSRASF